ncbi:MAG: hypothetical protein D8M18_01260 [Bacteroidetes bacterium]|nr:hypothetical protein [Bacteroidota bacterium]
MSNSAKQKHFHMKKTGIIVGLFIALCAFTNANAQSEKKGESPETKHERRIAHLKKELGLNEEQAKKIDAIDTEYKPKVKEANLQVQTAHQQKEDLLKEIDTKVKEVLTEEQKVKFEELKKKEKEKRKAEYRTKIEE